MSISIDIANASEAKELTTIALESKQYWGYSSDFIEMCRDELTLKEADFVNSLILVAKNNENIVVLFNSSLMITQDKGS